MPILEVKNLKKSYTSPEGEKDLVIDIPMFIVNQGEQIALQGGSGSGKTTFLNLIAGILKADDGSIVLAGQELSSLSEPERDRLRADNIGYVFQTFNLLQGYTVLENILVGMMFGNGMDKDFALPLLERVGLKDRMNYYPGQLSVGQQQRVAVARALANRPKLVLADEPTGNLDFRRAHEVVELIRRVCFENGAALLLVSHDQNVLKQFDIIEQLATINRVLKESIPPRSMEAQS
jgi:putative ABC transport system ATP-binding protein